MTAAGAVLWTVIALGTPPQPPSSQAQSPPPTGLIVGRVVDASSGRPVAGVIVSLSGFGAAPVIGPNASRQPRAMTNANGQFVFRRLAKGNYSLSANRPGYVDGAYGRRYPSGTTATLKLEDAQRVGDVVIPMWRQATISGTVTDESGEPSIGVQVRAFQRRIVGGRRRIMQGPTASTDDRGVYRLASLPPGEYIVAFVWREASVPTATAELMRSIGSNDPKVQEIVRERANLGGGFGTAGSTSAIQIGGSVADLGFFGSAIPPPTADEKALFIYPTQFYPRAASAARAAVLTLASGQERDGIDFSLRPVRTFRVSGTLLGPEGPMPNASLRLVPAGDDTMTGLETSVTMTGSGGDFTLLGVPSGQYTIKVLRIPRPPITTPNTTTMTQIQVGSSMVMTTSGPTNPSAPPAPITDEPTMFAELPVAVGNADVSDLLVTLQRGARITGRVEFDGTRERPDAASLTRVQISLDRADAAAATGPFTLSTPPPGRADETGAFKTYGVAAGRYLVRVGGAPAGWTLRSVTSEGRDVSETPIDLRTTDATNLVVTFTDRPTKLSGIARTSNGNADEDAVVIVFAADASNWSDYGMSAPRRIRAAHAGRDGSYSVEGMPPGEYYVAAIHEDTTPEWRDPRVLEDLARGAAQVRLVEGDTRTQDAKVVKGGSQ